MSYPERSGFL
uniref:Uncharacterized protein n=1 Tax=Lepeophtheirus salmonis TaxID=72036 RepID=A0A0K2V0X1_LEPSM